MLENTPRPGEKSDPTDVMFSGTPQQIWRHILPRQDPDDKMAMYSVIGLTMKTIDFGNRTIYSLR